MFGLSLTHVHKKLKYNQMVNKPNNDKEFVIFKSLTWHVEERDIRICIKGNLLIVTIYMYFVSYCTRMHSSIHPIQISVCRV